MPEMYGLFVQAYNMDPSFNGDLTSSSKPMIASSSSASKSTSSSTSSVISGRSYSRNDVISSSSYTKTTSSNTNQSNRSVAGIRRSRYI
jgi:hypothetical protein